MSKIADGELLNQAVGSHPYHEDLLSKRKNKNKRKLNPSSESSCHLMQSTSAVRQLSEKMVIMMKA